MKVCRSCGRVLQGKRWLPPGPGEVYRARRMGRLEKDTCQDCRRHPRTYSAVLQVRGMPREELEDLILDKLVESEGEGRLENVYLEGGEYRFTSKGMARDVARELKERGAELTETSKVVTYDAQKSRQKTRLTISAKFRFQPGDVAEYRGRKYLVARVLRGFIKTQEGRKVRLKDAEKVPARRQEGFYISKKPPMVFVEETKETVEVPEPGEGRVEVVRAGGRLWVRGVEE
jgi:NMD protein affecting ribosome stability and mRNA decay